MKAPQDIIIKPIITEKAMDGVQEKKYVFQVAKSANKIEIKKAVEELFNVSVEKVTTVNVTGKFKRMGVHRGKRPDTKKAYVLLKENSKTIEFFDGMI